MYGAEVWQIPTREINKILSTEMDVLRRSARKSMNEERTYKGNNGGEREAGHNRHHREEKTTMIWPRLKDARGENTKINYGMDTRGKKKERTSTKNMDGRSTNSHDNKTFRTRSVEKQGGMTFSFRKTATAVIKPDR
jgi:hypothetical protein